MGPLWTPDSFSVKITITDLFRLKVEIKRKEAPCTEQHRNHQMKENDIVVTEEKAFP